MIWNTLKSLARRIIPPPQYHQLRIQRVRMIESPPYHCVRFGSFRRTSPIHSGFDIGRGAYIDRYYIEQYLHENAADIHGRVLELSTNDYTVRFGGSRVTRSDVLDIRPGHPTANIIDDLTAPQHLPSDAFDCVILTQALNFIYDVRAAIHTVHRILKPGGCVLVSAAGISPIVPDEMSYCGDYWRFTHLSLRRLFEEVFPAEGITVESRGNVLSTLAFLHGLAVEELKPEELDRSDPNFQLCVLLRAVKAAAQEPATHA